MCCSCCTPTGLSIEQDRVLATIRSTWDGVCVYGVDGISGALGTVLIVGHQGSEYHFSLVAQNGERQRINDPLNQSHILSDIVAGRFPLLVG